MSMEELDIILDKYSFSKRPTKSGKQFWEIEKQIGFQLPVDYKYFLKSYSAFEGSVGPEYLSLWNVEDVLETNNNYEILKWLPNVIAIGSNMGGEFLGIEYMGQNSYRVVLSPFIGLEKQYHIEIGTSFLDMLIRLDNNVEWLQ